MRIGFFGGAFDPFHNEHKEIVSAALKDFQLDKIVVYPSYLPPHKNCSSPFEARMKMTEAALKGENNVVIDGIEGERNTVNPTFEILPILKKKYPADEYYFIMGGDSIAHFSQWIHPEKIAEEVTIAVVSRVDREKATRDIAKAEKDFHAKIVLSGYTGKPVSASEIKAKVAFGEVPDEVPGEVYEIIKAEGLYGEYIDLCKKVRANMEEKRFEHVKRTVFYALKLNTNLGLPFDKVFKATLLHDCAKHLHRAMEGVPPAVEHQFLGAELAESEYQIGDIEILNAIKYHATGKPEMTSLEKLVYSADMLEEGRTYPGVERLRKAIEGDFEKGFVACVNATLNKLKEDGGTIHPLTNLCAEYYNKINR